MEEQIKSKQRVAHHVDVLTGKREGITEEAIDEQEKS